MGSRRNWLIVWIVLHVMPWPNVRVSGNSYTRDSLNSVLYDYAFKKLHRPRTGRLYNVALPSNLSGIEVSVFRVRTRSLWLNGANFSSVEIPPKILPWPFTKRVDLVYQNFGNWSSYYYNVPNHTFVAPVLGLLAYDTNTSSINDGIVELKVMGDNPIIARFPNVSLLGDAAKCVRFGTNGTVEFSNVMARNSCATRSQGHFSIVVPYEPVINEKKREMTKWWVMGIAFGVMGLVLIILLGILMYKLIKRKRIRKMEKETERSEGLDIIWVGRSRMPSASGIRTQPVLENSYVP